MLVDVGAGLLVAVVVDDLYVVRCEPEGTRRCPDVAVHGDATFGRAVRVDHFEAEPSCETFDDLGRTLVAERDAQRVVGVVGALGLREEIRERLAGVVGVRRAVVPYVAGVTSDGAHPTCTALEWNSGMHT